VFAGLVAASRTTSFSVSNDSAFFGLRLTTLCVLAGIAQVSVGGRSSVGSAAVVASLAVLAMVLVAARRPLAPVDGTIPSSPFPPTGLAFVCASERRSRPGDRSCRASDRRSPVATIGAGTAAAVDYEARVLTPGRAAARYRSHGIH
jgi:hypothetical protein